MDESNNQTPWKLVIANCLAEVLTSDVSNKTKELRISALNTIRAQVLAYQGLGIIQRLLTAIAEKKCKFLLEITFYSKNKKQLAAFHKRFNEILEDDATQENGFGKGWLGDFANTFYPHIGAQNIECRGSTDCISEIEHKENLDFFRILTTTAWTAKIGLFYKITQDFYPDIKIAYVSEEGGCEYYCKWDDDGLFFNTNTEFLKLHVIKFSSISLRKQQADRILRHLRRITRQSMTRC